MPFEMRRIVFSQEELQEAVADYIQGTGMLGDGSSLVEVSPRRDELYELLVATRNAKGQRLDITLGEVYVAAALIAFCQKCKIPISKRAEKTIKATKRGVAMDMVIKE